MRPLVVALAFAFAIVACGDARGEDEVAVEEAIRTALTSTDPRACSAPYTQAYRVQAALGLRGIAREYERYCAANIRVLAARAVDVPDVTVNGARATARFAATGGEYAIPAARVRLRRIAGVWRLHRLDDVTIDRARFARQQALVARVRGGLSAAAAACLQRRLNRVPASALQTAIAAGDPAVLAAAVLACTVRPQLRAAGLGPAAATCVIRRLRATTGDARLMRLLLTRTPAAERTLTRAFRRAGAACR